jgi:hypothetical protein
MEISKNPIKFSQKLPIPRKSQESSRCTSACTKSTYTPKESPSPDKNILITPRLNTIVKELSCDSEVSSVEDPCPLINSIKSQDLLTTIKENKKFSKTPSENDIHKLLKSKNSLIKKPKTSSPSEMTQKIKELKSQVTELTTRASLCESELKMKSQENSDLKSMVYSLKEILSPDQAINKSNGNTCQSCLAF